MEKSGLLYATDYSEPDILACVSAYAQVTGNNQPVRAIVRSDHLESIRWLTSFDIQVTAAKIQGGTILLI